MDFPHWAWTEADANYLRVALLTQAVRKQHFDGSQWQKVLRLISKTKLFSGSSNKPFSWNRHLQLKLGVPVAWGFHQGGTKDIAVEPTQESAP